MNIAKRFCKHYCWYQKKESCRDLQGQYLFASKEREALHAFGKLLVQNYEFPIAKIPRKAKVRGDNDFILGVYSQDDSRESELRTLAHMTSKIRYRKWKPISESIQRKYSRMREKTLTAEEKLKLQRDKGKDEVHRDPDRNLIIRITCEEARTYYGV